MSAELVNMVKCWSNVGKIYDLTLELLIDWEKSRYGFDDSLVPQ